MQGYLTPTALSSWARSPIDLALWLHCPQGYLTSLCNAILWWIRLPLDVAWCLFCLQRFLLPKAEVLILNTNFYEIKSCAALQHQREKSIWLLRVLPFCVKKDLFLMFDVCIAHKAIWFLRVLPFCVQQYTTLKLVDSHIVCKDTLLLHIQFLCVLLHMSSNEFKCGKFHNEGVKYPCIYCNF